jgi:hypothetical protein
MALTAILPSKQYIKIDGTSGSSKTTYWTATAGIKPGDIITVTGSKSNDGVYTVTGFMGYNYDQYMMVTGRSIVDETSFTVNTDDYYGNSTTGPIPITDSADVRVGQTITGANIQAETTISAIPSGTEGINASALTLSQATGTAGIQAIGTTLTFTSSSEGAATVTIKARRTTGDRLVALGDGENGTVDIWSYNSVATPASENDSWKSEEIKPVLLDQDRTSEFLFSFSDEVLRVNDVNVENNAIVKWYGYIQRNQFNHTNGLSFSGWYEHPSFLYAPSIVVMPTSSQHTVATDAHYATVNAILEDGDGNDVQTAQLFTAITEVTSTFETATNALAANHLFEVGQVYSILSTSSAIPEVIMVRKSGEGIGTDTPVYMYRGYGGTTDAQIADNSGAIYKRGIGWNIGVTDHSDDGEWEDKTYEFWQTFIYDGNQESLPTKLTNTYALSSADKSLECTVYADRFYSGRISGGRIYIRESASHDPLTLFVDIDIVRGARMTLDSEYEAWIHRSDGNTTQNSGYYSAVSTSVGLKSVRQNLDTYETINGFTHDIKFNSIGKEQETYNAITVAGRRTFIANIVTKDFTGSKIRYGDRIMFSEINKMDTFLNNNFIDVSKGDYGEYTALQPYADRLIAFKHNLVHIINISSPSPSSWYLEDTIRNQGVSFHYSVTKTENGIVWANEAGCFLYDGRRVINIIENKVSVFESLNSPMKSWSDFANGSAHLKDLMVGYDSISNQLLIMRSPKDASTQSNICFIYDFDTKGWVQNSNIFTDSAYYTNFATDWNNNLIVGVETDSDSVGFKKYLPNAYTQGSQEFITRDIDFGQPGLKKKVYKVIVTYKATVAQTTPFEYAVDGTKIFSDFTGNFVATFSGGSTIDDTSGSPNISASDTVFVVDDGSLYSIGDICLISSEQVFVENTSGNSLTVVRGYNSSTAATHSDGDALTILKWDIATITPSSIISCQSLQLKFNPATANALIEINDITFEYRIIRSSVVS